MTVQKQMEQFINENNKSLMNEQKEKGDYFYKHFVENKPINKIPENIFVQYILPFFNPNNPMNEETYASFLTNWIALAGAPTLEVAVVDNKGAIIFLCPAMFDTEIINAKRDILNTKNVSNFFKAYLAQQDVNGFAANVFFNKNAYDIYKNLVKDNPKLEENRRRWETIFVRYNMMPAPSLGSGGPSINMQDSDDIFD